MDADTHDDRAIGHVTRGSIFDDLGYETSKGHTLKIRASLMNELIALVERQGWTQTNADEHLGGAQSRISLLLRGKISKFTIDALVDMQERAGIADESLYLRLAVGDS